MQKDSSTPSRLVTSKTISQTVIYDSQTYLWAKKLVFLPEVFEKLKPNPHYRQCHLLSRMKWFFLITALTCFLISFQTLKTSRWIFLLAGISSIIGTIFYSSKYRWHISQLMANLLTTDLERLPPNTTLYQLGELYNRQYQAPSLVKTIHDWDYVLMHSFSAVYLGTFLIYFLSLKKALIFFISTYAVITLCFKITYILRKHPH